MTPRARIHSCILYDMEANSLRMSSCGIYFHAWNICCVSSWRLLAGGWSQSRHTLWVANQRTGQASQWPIHFPRRFWCGLQSRILHNPTGICNLVPSIRHMQSKNSTNFWWCSPSVRTRAYSSCHTVVYWVHLVTTDYLRYHSSAVIYTTANSTRGPSCQTFTNSGRGWKLPVHVLRACCVALSTWKSTVTLDTLNSNTHSHLMSPLGMVFYVLKISSHEDEILINISHRHGNTGVSVWWHSVRCSWCSTFHFCQCINFFRWFCR